jgi:hypothetical protein
MTNGIGRVGWRTYVSPLPNPLWNGMLAYYTGDNTADDAKGTAHGTLTNGTTYGTGKINGGFSFDGINDTVTLSNTVTKFSSSTPFTYNVWVKAVSRTGFIYMDANASTAGTAIGFLGGTIAFAIGDVAQWFGSGIVIPLNTWTMVTITYNGIVNQSNNLLFYTNGTLAQGLKMDVSFNLPTTISNKQIGSGGWRSFFSGNIDELGIWGRALTTTEVTELYNAGAGKQYVAPVSSYTARTTAFATATGITDVTILGALNTFDLGLISNGLDTKMKALYPFVGGTSNTHKFNFMNPADTNAAFRLQFNGGLTFNSTGVLGGGVNGYANTYFTGSNWNSINDSSFGFYTRTTQGALAQCDIGAFSITYSNNFLATYYSDSNFYSALNSPNNTGNLAYANTESKGFYIANRTSSSVLNGWKNGVKIGTNTVSPVNLLNVPLYLFAYSNQGSPQLHSTKECQFAFIGDGLTDTQATNLSTLVHNMQTTLGRNY